MDLLASYDVKLSDDGEVLGFERRRRYHRSAADDVRG
jgi:Gas vesicle synthesis protein GvpO